MKWLFIVLSFLVIFSCKKKDETIDTPNNPKVNEFYYTFDTIRCSTENTFSTYVNSSSSDTIGVFAYHSICGDQFYFTMNKNVLPGVYPYDETTSLLNANFIFNNASENYRQNSGNFTIVENNTTEKYIKGTFELQMGWDINYDQNPINFSNGNFKIYY